MSKTVTGDQESTKITFSDKLSGLTYRHNINSPSVRYDYHINDDYEIFCFISGCAKYYIEGRVYSLKAGDVFIMNNRETHRLLSEAKTPLEFAVIHFNTFGFEFAKDRFHKIIKCFEDRKIGHDNLISEGINQLTEMYSYINEIDEYIKENSGYADICIWTVFLRMLVTINQLYEKKSKGNKDKRIRYNEKMLCVLKYINANITEAITLDSLSKKFFINKQHLCRTFKNSTGFSVTEYITYKRVMYAKELIINGIPVTQACFDSGFMSYSNFYKAFRKTFKCAPRRLQD